MIFLRKLLTSSTRPSRPGNLHILILYGTGIVLLSACLAGAQFFLIQNAFESRHNTLVNYARQVIEGFPEWRIYQSRVLGPFSVEGLHNLTGWKFEMCYDIMTFLFLFVFFLILLFVARALWKSTLAMFGIVSAALFLNTMLMQGPLLCLWDYANLIIFTILVWAILKSKSLWFIFIPLAIGIFNHEIVLIVAGWLAIDAILRLGGKGKWILNMSVAPQWRQFIIAAILLVAGFFIIEWIRDSLLIHTTGVISPEIDIVTRFGAVMLPENLEALKTSFCHDMESQRFLVQNFGSKFVIVFNPLIFGILATAIWGLLSPDYNIRRISLLHIILWASTFTFGWIYETRVWLVFVPFLILVLPRLLPNASPGVSPPGK